MFLSSPKNLTGSSSSLILKPLPSDDPKRRKPDISLAKSKLNWEPKVSLNTGINNTIKLIIFILFIILFHPFLKLKHS